MRISAPCFFLASMLLGPSLVAQSLIYKQNGVPLGTTFGSFGTSVAMLGDVNGDGCDDYAVGAPTEDAFGVTKAGVAYVYSGCNGMELFHVHGGTGQGPGGIDLPPVANGQFGASVAAVGDVDGDGVDDFAVGCPESGKGFVRIFRGGNGQPLYSIFPNSPASIGQFGTALSSSEDIQGKKLIVGAPTIAGYANLCSTTLMPTVEIWQLGTFFPMHLKTIRADYSYLGGPACTGTGIKPCVGSNFGAAVAAGDFTGDGIVDFVVGARYYDANVGGCTSTSQYGRVSLIEGMSFSVVFQTALATPKTFSKLGSSVAVVGDWNGDGVNDVAMGAPGYDTSSLNQAGIVYLYGAPGGVPAFYQSFTGAFTDDQLGQSISRLGNIAADAREEIAVGSYNEDSLTLSNTGTVKIIQGGSAGSVVFKVWGDTANEHFGTAVAAGGDINGDQIPDILGASGSALNTKGTLKVFSSKKLMLTANNFKLSAATGGTHAMSIDAGASFAGKLYLVAGSLSGIQPGFAIDGLTVSLSFDAYTQITIANPNQGLLVATLGTLDGAGKASPQFVLPPSSSSVVGLTAHHAGIVFDLALGKAVAVSHAAPVTVVP